jgi:hypoxanthine-DNA glycosylase
VTREHHPYGTFVPRKPKAMIIGSFPIGKFTNPDRRHEIKEHEIDFFFGGERNLLWKLLSEVFNVPLTNKDQIIKMLETEGLGVGDVIESCCRKNGGASDADLIDIHWNHDLLHIIRKNKIKKIFFTSRKVEHWFNKMFPKTLDLEKITLISPSAQSIRSLTRRDDFKAWSLENPDEKKIKFFLESYRRNF